MTLATAAIILFADIFMMGDSTMCDYKPGSYPQEGWGQRLRTFTKDGVKVHNRAVGGISSKTFIDSGRWQKVLDDIQPGDYAIMAFGHNDATKSKPQRYCNKEAYAKNMSLFIDGIREKGATPVLATSIIHIGGVREVERGTGNGERETGKRCLVRADAAGLGPYLAATRELAVAKDVPLLDLNAAAKTAFEKMTKKEIESHYMVLGPAESWYALKGKSDRCHPRDKGADFYARTAVELAKANAPKLFADCFKDPASVPFVATPKPKGIDEAYQKLLADEAEKLAKGTSDKFYSYTYDEPMEIGNYDVTVNLGTGKGPSANYVKFMGRRLAIDRTDVKAGETKAVTFTARVPGPYTTRRGDANSNRRLIIEMFSNAPQADMPVFEPLVVPNPKARTIYLCGDSTVTDQRNEPWGSWGQILPAFVRQSWSVSNFARSGLALKTFEHEGRLKRILEHLKKDDWVVIQFGHNDQKIKGEEPENGYTRRLNEWIDKISAKGAFVVLVTPVERRRFDEKTGEHGEKTLAGYAEAVKSVAAARGVPVVDLNDASYRMHAKMGAKGSAKIQCNNKGKIDNTHHNVYGAYEMARIVAAGLAEIPTIKDAIRDPYRSFNPESPDGDPKIPPSGKTDYTKPEGS
jgi:lysophospholipase L1-like esterase